MLTGSRVEGVDSNNSVVFGINFVSVVVEEQIDILFSANDRFFFCVAELFVSTG